MSVYQVYFVVFSYNSKLGFIFYITISLSPNISSLISPLVSDILSRGDRIFNSFV